MLYWYSFELLFVPDTLKFFSEILIGFSAFQQSLLIIINISLNVFS